MLQSVGKKRENIMSEKWIHTTQEHSPTKVTPVIDFTDKPDIKYDVPVVENTFVDDCN